MDTHLAPAPRAGDRPGIHPPGVGTFDGAITRPLRAARTAIVASGRLGGAVALAIGGGAALVSGLALPRGPVTAEQGLVVIATSLLVGLAAGAITRTRWALVLAPLGYLIGSELARLGVAGATFGPLRLDTAYGIVALVVGRGVHLLLALVPLAAGVGIALALARPRRTRSWVAAGALVAAVTGLAVVVATPGSTPPVLGPDGEPIGGSIAELSTVRLGGLDQAISVRAADPASPVLLYLAGGPGQSDIAFARALLEPLTEDFVVVTWDQRGTGRSYPALEPVSTFTLDRAIDDTIELAEHLRRRFDEDAIYLLGESWGSTLGVLAVQQRPDLFHAYIGSGQMISQRVTDQVIWRDLLAHARATGDEALHDQVLALGEPPYRDSPWANSVILGYYPLLETPYTPPAAYVARGEASGVGPFGIGGSEYGFIENANVLRGLLDTFSLMYPQLQAIDFRVDVPSLDVPVYMLDGEHELRGRRDLAHEWFAGLVAPHKQLVTYPHAGHAVAFEQVDAVHRLLVDEIVPATYPAGRP
jgi:pimeloyl-ACP methyl ester carboxylesterase